MSEWDGDTFIAIFNRSSTTSQLVFEESAQGNTEVVQVYSRCIFF